MDNVDYVYFVSSHRFDLIYLRIVVYTQKLIDNGKKKESNNEEVNKILLVVIFITNSKTFIYKLTLKMKNAYRIIFIMIINYIIFFYYLLWNKVLWY